MAASESRIPADTLRAMVLYTCPARTHGATTPIIKHPCGVAAKALDDAGHEYTVKVVGGFKNVPLSRRGRRSEIRELTGQEDVPVLVLDDGTPIAGSEAIVAWASGAGT
jgi:glutaredoxin